VFKIKVDTYSSMTLSGSKVEGQKAIDGGKDAYTWIAVPGTGSRLANSCNDGEFDEGSATATCPQVLY